MRSAIAERRTVGKRTRKPSALQRDKKIIADARYLKSVGVLSKRTKLHGGKFVSPRVARKVQELAFIHSKNYTARKTTKAAAEKAKKLGYQVVQGNRVVMPKDQRYYRALRRAETEESFSPPGVIPVKQGVMEIVPLATDLMDIYKLVDEYDQNPRVFEDMKMSGEMFTFKLFGHMAYQPFPNMEMLVDYLRHYRGLFNQVTGKPRAKDNTETAESLVLFRLNPGDARLFIENREERVKRFRGSSDTRQDRRGRRGRRYQSREDMNKVKADRERAKDREKKRKKREAMTEAQKAVERDKQRSRMKAYRKSLRDDK